VVIDWLPILLPGVPITTVSVTSDLHGLVCGAYVLVYPVCEAESVDVTREVWVCPGELAGLPMMTVSTSEVVRVLVYA
jgi:hypothetical protein